MRIGDSAHGWDSPHNEETDMKVIRTEVNWMHGWSNPPRLILYIDRLPEPSEYEYEQLVVEDGETLYFAAHECGAVSFFCHNPRNQNGYGGSRFDLRLKSGREVSLKGPWSSRAGVMNQHFRHCVDVVVIDDRGYRLSASITLELAHQAAQKAGVHMVQSINPDGEIVYRPESLPTETIRNALVSGDRLRRMLDAERTEFEQGTMGYMIEAMEHGVGPATLVRHLIDESLDAHGDVDLVSSRHYAPWQ